MEKTKESFTGKQGDFFPLLPDTESVLHADNAPDLDIELELTAAVVSALRTARNHGMSRERIVERMNLCLPKPQHITLRQLNAWCAQSKEHHPFPAKYLPAFMWACMGIVAPVQVICKPLQLDVVDEDDQLAAELGKVLQLEGELKKRKRLLQTNFRR